MARTYTHMPLGERVLSFLDQRLHELKEAKRDAEAELAMWTAHRQEHTFLNPEKLALTGLAEPPAAERELLGWLDRRQGELKQEIAEAEREIRMWETHRKNLNPCPACNGYGKLRVVVAQDESYMEKCSACGGLARRPSSGKVIGPLSGSRRRRPMIEMNITAKTTEVLDKLRANRAAHADLVKEAREGYCQAAESALKEKLDQLRKGKLIALSFNLAPPQDYTREYDAAIAMLELHKNAGQETITLTAMDVRQFIMDEWEWAARFLTSNSLYSARTRTLGEEKGYVGR